ncbi:cytochrome d ubiquinol oxidase subunit II [Candidatus Poribacteria bacterium]|nr:cytochrome d ubiquinol oxidase subunit II [Candidatus Poribacteria bacterium]
MLETIWFVLWGILWAVYFMLDGFDLGLGTLMPALAKNESDKQVVYGAIGPFWDGNEVWLLTAGGVTFAAFPGTYAVMFSALYSALMLILFALIVRGVALEFRNNADSVAWKKVWDVCMVFGSVLPAILFGVAFANIFQGIPIDAEGIYRGTLLTLLNAYGLLGGVFFLALFLEHGAIWLAVKSDGDLQKRAGSAARTIWPVLLVGAVVFLVVTWFRTGLYDNYLKNPVLFVIPAVAVASLLTTRVFIAKAAWWRAWFASSLVIVSATLFGVVGLFPVLLPSSLDSAYSMTIHNSASSPLTLKIMLGVALTFIPVVILYQGWVYNLFKGKATGKGTAFGDLY